MSFHKNQLRMHIHEGSVFLHKRDTPLVMEWVRRYTPSETIIREREYQGAPPKEFDEYLDYKQGGPGTAFPGFYSHEYWTIQKDHPLYQQAHDEAWNITVFEQYSQEDETQKDYQRRKQFLHHAGYEV